MIWFASSGLESALLMTQQISTCCANMLADIVLSSNDVSKWKKHEEQ